MSDIELTTLSTLCWLVATVALFILLAGWSAGESWGLTASLVHGVRGWADRDRRTGPVTSPFREPLRPILDPYAFVRRPAGATSAADTLGGSRGSSRAGAGVPGAELIELGERPFRR
jgi:hypothetical protein